MLYEVISTPIGPIGVVVRMENGKEILVAVRVGHPTIAETEIDIVRKHPHAETVKGLQTTKVLRKYAETGRADFDSLMIDEGGFTDFQRSVREACRKIPFGETVSYSELGERAGVGRAAARAVGSVMRRNNCPIVMPCHRVVPSGGPAALGNYSAPSGPALKKRLLDLERSAR
jgi:O-6-methylguanine DNA methyltransferase